jgi:hypothetical protein
MSVTSSWNPTVGVQPTTRRALAESPMKNLVITDAHTGLKKAISTVFHGSS